MPTALQTIKAKYTAGGSAPKSQLTPKDEAEVGAKPNAQDSLFGEAQRQFASPANLQKVRAKGPPPAPKPPR